MRARPQAECNELRTTHAVGYLCVLLYTFKILDERTCVCVCVFVANNAPTYSCPPPTHTPCRRWKCNRDRNKTNSNRKQNYTEQRNDVSSHTYTHRPSHALVRVYRNIRITTCTNVCVCSTFVPIPTTVVAPVHNIPSARAYVCVSVTVVYIEYTIRCRWLMLAVVVVCVVVAAIVDMKDRTRRNETNGERESVCI